MDVSIAVLCRHPADPASAAATGQSELNGSASGTADTVSFHALIQPPFEEQLLTSTLWPE